MAAVSETGNSLVKAQVKQQQPPSPAAKSQQQQQQLQNDKQLHNLLQQTSTVNHNGGNSNSNSHHNNSPKSSSNGGGQYHFLQQHLQHLASENLPPLQQQLKNSPNGKSQTNRTLKASGLFPASSDNLNNTTNGLLDIKVEAQSSSALSTTTTKSVMSPKDNSSNRDEKKINNNSVSYTSGGRLKFFKEGRFLLELTHKQTGEGETWVPIKKKVYWPPPGPVKAESSPSVHSATSEGGSDSIPSPFPSSGLCSLLPHRIKLRPNIFNPQSQPQNVLDDLVFAMKPPPCIVPLRKKIRHFGRKCRQPYSNIVVGAFLMRLEAEAVKSRPPKRPIDFDQIKKASRLENCVNTISTKAKQKRSGPLISIQSWKSSNPSTSAATSKATSKLTAAFLNKLPSSTSSGSSSSSGVATMRIKSELCPVTETCTAATLPPSSPSTHSKSSKSKAENRNICSTTTSTKTLPITPTIARIKQEPSNSIQISQNCTSLISPDMQRVKVEIGRQFSPTPHHMSQTPNLPTSPLQQQQQQQQQPLNDFASPRKRYLQDFDNTSPASKRHRLSTDSRGSGGSGDGGAASMGLPSNGAHGGGGSPHPPHLFMHPGGVASPPRPAGNGQQPYRMSSFSIDSIISSGSREDRVDNSTSNQVISSPKPIKPVALTPRRSPVTSQHSSTPLVVPITPYQSRGLDPRTPLDPRLAHLAGVAADPRLGLSPSAASMSYLMNPFYSQYLATASHLAAAAAAGLWRPPPPPQSPSLATSPAPRTLSMSSAATIHSAQSPSPTPPPSGIPPSISAWAQQYRGEPKVEAPVRREVQRQEQPMDTSAELPLNLSMKR